MNHRDFGDPKWIKILFQAKVKYEEYVHIHWIILLTVPPQEPPTKRFQAVTIFLIGVCSSYFDMLQPRSPWSCLGILDSSLTPGRVRGDLWFPMAAAAQVGGGRTWDAGIPDLVGTLMIIWKDRFGPFWLVPDEKNHGYRPDEVESWFKWSS